MTRTPWMWIVTLLALGLAGSARAQEQVVSGVLREVDAKLWLAQGSEQTPLQVVDSMRKEFALLVNRPVKLRVLPRLVSVPGGAGSQYQALRLHEVLEPKVLACAVTVRRSGALDLAIPDGAGARPRQVIGEARYVLRARPDRSKAFVRGWDLGDRLLLLGVRVVTVRSTTLRIGPPWASYPASAAAEGRSLWVDGAPVNGLMTLVGGARVRVQDVTFDPSVERDRPVPVFPERMGLVGVLDD